MVLLNYATAFLGFAAVFYLLTVNSKGIKLNLFQGSTVNMWIRHIS